MTTIYVVTEGSYSAKENMAVFSRKEDAERFRDILNPGTPYDSADIEEFELDVVPESYLSRNRLLWYVSFEEDSADIDYIRLSPYDSEIPEDGQDHHVYGGRIFWVWAESKEAAAKIAMERRSVWLANEAEETP
jgi:hypothetical protein